MSRSLRHCATTLLAGLTLAALLLLAAPARAVEPVTCTATMTALNFGNVNPLSSQTDASAALSYSCTNNEKLLTLKTTVCVSIGPGPHDTTNANPRRMLAGTGQYLQFQIYKDSTRNTLWGGFSGTAGTPRVMVNLLVLPGMTVSDTVTLYGRVLAGQATTTPGSYQEVLNDSKVTANASLLSFPSSCNTGSGTAFSFSVNASVTNPCTVITTDIDLGSVASMAANTSGSGTINVTCSSGTSYNVGLSPSSGDLNGSGLLSGTGSNTDKIPYQLKSGSAGPVWGNTATSGSVGNGVTGTGNGLAQPITVFVTVPSANYTPDSYADTVTVNVNY